MMRMVQGLVGLLALPGEVLIEKGAMSRGLFFIMRGAVRIVGNPQPLSLAQLARLRAKFDAYDADGSGAIDSRELQELVRSLGYVMKRKELANLVADIDSDGSGLIEFKEFIELLQANKDILKQLDVGDDGARSTDYDDLDLSEGFFGENSVLTRLPAEKTVRALKFSDFFLLPRAVFNSVLEENRQMRNLVEEFARLRNVVAAEHSSEIPSFKRSMTRQKTMGRLLARGGSPPGLAA